MAIVTPNHLHAKVATAFLRANIAVICDKPMTATLPEAEELAALAAETSVPFGADPDLYRLSDGARGAPDDRRRGTGAVRHVQVEYLQDWLAGPVEQSGQKQAVWRTDPGLSGEGGCIADIGTHAVNLATFVSGLEFRPFLPTSPPSEPGRRLDDNAAVLSCVSTAARRG